MIKNIRTRVSIAVAAAIAASSTLVPSYASASSLLLEEVTVTATRREESSNTIPVSLSTVGGEQLKVFGIEDVQGLHTAVPNLSVFSVGGSSLSPILNIRGLLNRSSEATVDTTVGTYYDEIFLARGYSVLGQMLDVERVEVLRGPQGTLFGRNTIGGAIQIVSKTPNLEGDYDGQLTLNAGNLNLREGSFGVTLPLVEDKLAVRFAGKVTQDDGYTDSYLVDDSAAAGGYVDGVSPVEKINSNDRDSQAYRVAVGFAPSDKGRLDLSYYHAESDTNGVLNRGLNGDVGSRIDGPTIFGLGIGDTPSSFFDFYSAVTDVRPSAESDVDIYIAKYVHSFDSFDMKFIYSRAEAEQSETFNTDGLVQPGPIGPGNTLPLEVGGDNFGEVEQDTYELQFSGESGRFEWIAGLYYFKEEALDNIVRPLDSIAAVGFAPQLVGFAQFLAMPNDPTATFISLVQGTSPAATAASPVPSLGNLQQAAGLLEGFSSTSLVDVSAENTSQSIYGSVNYAFTDKLKLRVGGRYTEDTKGFVGRTVNTSPLLGSLVRCIYTGELLASAAGCSSEGIIPDETNFYNFTWDVSLDYMLNDSTFLYGKVGTGYRTGGVSLNATNAVTATPFNEDEVLSYEVGIKAGVTDNLRVNLTAFHVDYSDIQLSVNAASPGSCIQQILTPVTIICNVDDATSQGVEFDVTWQITDSFGLKLDGGYTDFEFDDSATREPIFNPEWSYNLTAIYESEIAGYPLRTVLTYQESDDWNSTDDTAVVEAVAPGTTSADGYQLLNLRLSLKMNDNIEVAAWGRNLTDDEYLTSSVSALTPVAAVGSGFPGAPRTYGVEFTYSF